jgi:hypothetical protein
MNVMTTAVQACEPTLWTGRYGRVMGDSAVFHLRYARGRLWPVVIWETDSEIVTCHAADSMAARELVATVARAKRHAGGDGGGSFLINEYGKIIVPASDGDGRRFLAGRINVPLLFDNPLLSGTSIDLGDAGNCRNGDSWNLPYVGVPYHLHRNGRIYFYQYDDQGGHSVHPPKQDLELIRAIRHLRPYGPVRILVTPGGLVLTKISSGMQTSPEESWQPVFVGISTFGLRRSRT